MSDLVERINTAVTYGYMPRQMREVASEAAARISELETALAEAEGRVIADVVAWLRGSLFVHYEEPSEWELAVETYATALETGEWKK